MSVDKVLAVAESQLGEGEHPPFSNHNKFTEWYDAHVENIGDGPWCDMFVSWVGDQAGESMAVGRFAYCPDHVVWFKAHGRWGSRPRAGAVVFFDWSGNGVADHVGFVKSDNGDGTITTVEGNSGSYNGGTVREVVRSSCILGYGYPAYAVGNSPTPPPSGGSAGSGKPTLTRILRYEQPNMQGSDVLFVQKRLNRRGYGLAEDGLYGPATTAAVEDFQSKNGLASDGEVGPLTWAKL